eukprot:TRINITY_DN66880_c5_g2_i1.p1 TRINITY_DN66880_c5_g2~~TRINITY_DN66880_c5_g2_i1.p1  ORF type:complete len:715 (+),score=56.34 TRINITY_DN66880_c5_g2_i1:36-2147(+)
MSTVEPIDVDEMDDDEELMELCGFQQAQYDVYQLRSLTRAAVIADGSSIVVRFALDPPVEGWGSTNFFPADPIVVELRFSQEYTEASQPPAYTTALCRDTDLTVLVLRDVQTKYGTLQWFLEDRLGKILQQSHDENRKAQLAKELCSMGFKEQHVISVLQQQHPTIDKEGAISALLAMNVNTSGDCTAWKSQQQEQQQGNQEGGVISVLTCMGFSSAVACVALQSTNGNLDQAASLLWSQGTPTDHIPTTTTTTTDNKTTTATLSSSASSWTNQLDASSSSSSSCGGGSGSFVVGGDGCGTGETEGGGYLCSLYCTLSHRLVTCCSSCLICDKTLDCFAERIPVCRTNHCQQAAEQLRNHLGNAPELQSTNSVVSASSLPNLSGYLSSNSVLRSLFERESSYPDCYVFYHQYVSAYGQSLLAEIYAELTRWALWQPKRLSSDVQLRIDDRSFRQWSCVQSWADGFLSAHGNDHCSMFKEHGICANLSLASGTECVPAQMFTSGGANNTNVQVNTILQKMFTSCGLPSLYIDGLAQLHSKMAKVGCILCQIFIHNSVVDSLVYPCEPYGKRINIRTFSDFITNWQKNPTKNNTTQVRIMMRPTECVEWEKVKIFRATSTAFEWDNLYKEIHVIFQKMMVDFVAQKLEAHGVTNPEVVRLFPDGYFIPDTILPIEWKLEEAKTMCGGAATARELAEALVLSYEGL